MFNLTLISLYRRRAISSLLANLILIALLVAAGITIYNSTIGYLAGSNPLKNQDRALQIQSVAQIDSNLVIYVKNIGTISLKLDPKLNSTIYVDDKKIPSSSYAMTNSVVDEGAMSTITITSMDQNWRGKTINIKVVASDGTFSQTTKYIN